MRRDEVMMMQAREDDSVRSFVWGGHPPTIAARRQVLDRPLWRRTADCTFLQIRQKLSSYVHQDQRKGRAAADPPLTPEATSALLEAVQYRCVYCQCTMERVWRTPRDPRQWTLDRIDNDRPHQLDNVVPSCMECNLRRRARNYWRFRHGADIVAEQHDKTKNKKQQHEEEWTVVKEE